MGSGVGYAMQVQKEGVTDSNVSVEVKKEAVATDEHAVVKCDACTLTCPTVPCGAEIEMTTKVAMIKTKIVSTNDRSLANVYNEGLQLFLKNYNESFEVCAKELAFEIVEMDTSCSTETFTAEELVGMVIERLAEQHAKDKEAEFDDEKAMAAVAATSSQSWSLIASFSWVPLWVFRKSLMSLLTSGSFGSAGVLSLLMLVCPQWITTVLGRDILPHLAKLASPLVAKAALESMKFSQKDIDFFLKYLKSALGV